MWELSAYCLLSMMLCYDPSNWTKLMGASLGTDRLDARNCSWASPQMFLSVLWRPALSLSLKCDSSEQLKTAALIVHECSQSSYWMEIWVLPLCCCSLFKAAAAALFQKEQNPTSLPWPPALTAQPQEDGLPRDVVLTSGTPHLFQRLSEV